jgi:hypothetical protein
MNPIKPFTTNANYIESEIHWLCVRTSRLAAEQELRAAERDINSHGTRVGRRHKPVAADEARRLATVFRTQEDKLRADIDARIEATRKSGVTLGLDRLCEQHDLAPYERLALLVAVVPTLGEKLTQEVLGKLDSYIVNQPSVEMLIILTESQSVEDRLKVRSMFNSPEVPLVKLGLISMDFHRNEASPADLPGAQFSLTEMAFNTIVGLDG